MEWEEIKRDFNDKWNFPGCCGAIDGKHIAIRAPANCGSTFYNYKKSNSLVLMAVVGPNYKFIYIDVGSNRSLSKLFGGARKWVASHQWCYLW